MVKKAIEADPKLSAMGSDISVYAKGSYANRTNIPSDSDVDIAVHHNGIFFNEYPAGTIDTDHGFSVASYTFPQFRTDVAQAIINYFGRQEVDPKGKAIKVRSNTARVDADVIPQAVHLRILSTGTRLQGAAISIKGNIVYNWPQQDYDNGVEKNERTGRRYKAFVRVLKNLRCDMEESGVTSAKGIASFLIACLVWNVPDEYFEGEDYFTILDNILTHLISMTSDFTKVKEWGEVNELKYLFRESQAWRLASTHAFLVGAQAFLYKMQKGET